MRPVARNDGLPVERGRDATARLVLERLGLADSNASFPGMCHDRPAQRVLAPDLRRACGGEERLRTDAGNGADVHDRWRAIGEGSGLVENDRVDRPEGLKEPAALDDRAVVRRAPDAAQDRERRPGGDPAAPATMTTEIVVTVSRVTAKVSAAAPRAK